MLLEIDTTDFVGRGYRRREPAPPVYFALIGISIAALIVLGMFMDHLKKRRD